MINYQGDIDEIIEGAKLLFGKRDEELTITVKKEGTGLKIDKYDTDITLCYNNKTEFFRAMVLLLEDFSDKSEIHIRQVPKFKTIGLMLRTTGGSLTVNAIKAIIRHMARMGMNFLMLYTEEAFEVDGLPYHGYMRGRYTVSELKECDEYADMFGIEMIPCIQALAHLRNALRWEYLSDIKDTEENLLVGEDKTYAFLEKIIKTASEPYKSKRINLGLDEAFSLGLGNYLRKNGYERKIDIFIKHLNKLSKIVEKLGLEPMMWSDMYLSTSSAKGDMYDPELVIPQEVIDAAPFNMDLVYWDYYNEDKDSYRHALAQHKRFNCKTIFAGGIWTWNGHVPNIEKTYATTKIALEVCKEMKIDEVIATVWGITPDIYTILPGMQMYAEYSYQDEVTDAMIKKRFFSCTHEHYDDFAMISKLDYITERVSNNWYAPSNPSSFLLWQNIMMGLFDKHIEEVDTYEYYNSLSKKLDEISKRSNYTNMFAYYSKLASVLCLKANIGVQIKSAYDNGDKAELKMILDMLIPKIKNQLIDLRDIHMKMWLDSRMAFGWERFDIIYGSLIASTDTAVYRISSYLQGAVSHLEEIEAERLYYSQKAPDKSGLSWNERSFFKTFSADLNIIK